MTTENTKFQECCPPFEPSNWHNQVHVWDNKMFVKDHVRTILHAPMNFGEVITRLMAKMEAAGATSPDWLGLSDHTSKWNMDIYVATDRMVPNADNVTISGKIYSRVYEGDFRDTKKWCIDFENEARASGYNISKWYMWYTTCPKCAKKYGKNYVVVLGKID
ncbi:MAG TPA: hypothetical protein PLZ52_04675 [Bacteroidales bacterium]|nr:hypothetical protein [Bacteroidales bacterium]HOE04487.1 hypothetical protein [Bacteroidales bacterium]HQL69494.1 hypothetical protein [Bacteroidales bacterium]